MRKSKFCNKKELSEILGVPERKIRTWTEGRKIPYIKPGKRTIIYDIEKVIGTLGRDYGVENVFGSKWQGLYLLRSCSGGWCVLPNGLVAFVQQNKKARRFLVFRFPEEVLAIFERKRLREQIETVESLSPNPEAKQSRTKRK
jgi:hypothetical protein